MTVALAALPQFFDNAGNPLSGGKVFTYAAGTLTPLASYTDRGGGTPNSNPVILDSAGRADIWLSTNVAYKLIVKDSTEATTYDTVDDFYAGADPSQLVAAGIVPATGGTYTGPVIFESDVSFNGTAAQALSTLDTLGVSAVQNANLWTNSEFYINQAAVATAADATYGWDQVVALCDGGSVSISTFDTAGAAIGGSAGRLLQPDVVAKRMGMVQICEARDVLSFRGKNLTFTAQLRSTAATTVRMALVAWTGAQDAPTRDVVNTWSSTTYTAGNFFVANTSTIAVVASSLTANEWTEVTVSSASPGGVAVPSGLKNLYMVIWTDQPVAQNVTLDVTAARCGQGTSAQIWTAPNFQSEMAKCQRFLYIPNGVLQGRCTTTAARFIVAFPQLMRTTPTTTISSTVISWEEMQVAPRGYTSCTLSAASLSTGGGYFEITGVNSNGVPTAGAIAQLNSPSSFRFSTQF